MNELALFAGAGGGILGGKLLGWRTVCAVERDAYAAQVLAQRQNDGLLEAFPIWSDVTSFDGKPWRGIVDVISGGFPCQDISAAGKGAGITGERSGLWKEFARIIGEVRPTYTFIENSPMLTIRGLDTVLCDLAERGYDAEWDVISAADVGANHERKRIWIVAKQRHLFSHAEHDGAGWGKQQQKGVKEKNSGLANAHGEHGEWRGESQQPASAGGEARHQSTWCSDESNATNAASIRQPRQGQSIKRCGKAQNSHWKTNLIKSISERSQWQSEPNVDRVVNGIPFRMDKLKAIGNAQVSLCAATAFNLLKGRLDGLASR